MNYLFYRYGNICEDDYIAAFASVGLTAIEEKSEMTDKSLLPSQQVALVQKALDSHHPLFVFSINYFPAIAEICHVYGVKYVCQTVDCPVLELFSKTLSYDTNYVFLFDKMQYETFAGQNPEHIFYMPLACNISRYDALLSGISSADKKRFAGDISFVGSLYTEKDPLKKLTLSKYDQGYIKGMITANEQMPYSNILESMVTEELIRHMKEADSGFYQIPTDFDDMDHHICAHSYVGISAAANDRIRTLNALAKHFETTLYTRSDCSPLQNVRIRDGISTHTEMPKVFHLSKINLNMTIPPIQTGLPLRIFDIMGCGGFVMTNGQEEIASYFTSGVELETYNCLEELIEKCEFYLTHEDARKQIAQTGYLAVKGQHQYLHRVTEIIRRISQ